ncbi:hypothetical protein ES708_05752 [subsurface metagenome]
MIIKQYFRIAKGNIKFIPVIRSFLNTLTDCRFPAPLLFNNLISKGSRENYKGILKWVKGNEKKNTKKVCCYFRQYIQYARIVIIKKRSKKMSEEKEEMRHQFRNEFIDYDIWIQEFSPKMGEQTSIKTTLLLFNINNNLGRIADNLEILVKDK